MKREIEFVERRYRRTSILYLAGVHRPRSSPPLHLSVLYQPTLDWQSRNVSVSLLGTRETTTIRNLHSVGFLRKIPYSGICCCSVSSSLLDSVKDSSSELKSKLAPV